MHNILLTGFFPPPCNLFSKMHQLLLLKKLKNRYITTFIIIYSIIYLSVNYVTHFNNFFGNTLSKNLENMH